jgi:hypothetical protein
MKQEWKEPKLELLDVRETMAGSWEGGHDLIFDKDDKGWVPDGTVGPIFGGGLDS